MLVRCLGRAKGFAVKTGRVKTTHPPFAFSQHITGVSDPFGSGFRLFGRGDPVDPIEPGDSGGIVPGIMLGVLRHRCSSARRRRS